MRAVLVFPPVASPTYVPLGLASLAPFIQREVPGCDLGLLDLNLESWVGLAQADPLGEQLLDFVRGRGEDFYDEVSYTRHQQTWNRLGARLGQLSLAARRFLESEAEPEDELRRLLEDQSSRVRASDPELVGLSVVFPEQLLFALALARWLVRSAGGPAAPHQGPRVVLGGASLKAVRADDLLQRFPEVDSILLGEGELGAAGLCGGAPPEQIPGLVFRRAGRLQHNARATTTSLKWLPPPDFAGLPLERYFNPTPVLPALLSRGCRWRRCRFCAHNFSFSGYRQKPAEAFAEELEQYQRAHGARHFYLADQYIEATALERLSHATRQRGTSVYYHAMGRPSPEYSPARLELCFEGGCRWISWGVETGSQRLLEVAGKGTQVETAAQVVRQAKAAGISNLLMMIFGLPTSTDEDLEATFRFLEEVYPSIDSLTASSFVLFADTAFARQAASHRLHILGSQEILGQGPGALRSLRLRHREVASDGSLRPPRGPLEIAAWERRRGWLGSLPFLDRLCAEHYLLYAEQRARTRQKPLLPYPKAA